MNASILIGLAVVAVTAAVVTPARADHDSDYRDTRGNRRQSCTSGLDNGRYRDSNYSYGNRAFGGSGSYDDYDYSPPRGSCDRRDARCSRSDARSRRGCSSPAGRGTCSYSRRDQFRTECDYRRHLETCSVCSDRVRDRRDDYRDRGYDGRSRR